MHIGDKSRAGAQSTIVLDNATETFSAVRSPTNKKITQTRIKNIKKCTKM